MYNAMNVVKAIGVLNTRDGDFFIYEDIECAIEKMFTEMVNLNEYKPFYILSVGGAMISKYLTKPRN